MKGNGFTRFYTVLTGVLFAAMLLCCTEKAPAPPVDEGLVAGGVALECYKALYIQKRPEVFLRKRIMADNINEEQREQLITLYKQHVLRIERERGAVRNIDFSRAEPDTALHVMQVFLKLNYGDGTHEEIVVPMVQVHGEWRME